MGKLEELERKIGEAQESGQVKDLLVAFGELMVMLAGQVHGDKQQVGLVGLLGAMEREVERQRVELAGLGRVVDSQREELRRLHREVEEVWDVRCVHSSTGPGGLGGSVDVNAMLAAARALEGEVMERMRVVEVIQDYGDVKHDRLVDRVGVMERRLDVMKWSVG